MIKRFSAQGGTSIVLLKDRVINISELHLQRGESHWLSGGKKWKKVHTVILIFSEKASVNVSFLDLDAYSCYFVIFICMYSIIILYM